MTGAALLWLVLTVSVRAESARPLGLDLYRPVPEENLLTPEKVKLGHVQVENS